MRIGRDSFADQIRNVDACQTEGQLFTAQAERRQNCAPMSTTSSPTTIAPGSGALAAILVNLAGHDTFAKLNGPEETLQDGFPCALLWRTLIRPND